MAKIQFIEDLLNFLGRNQGKKVTSVVFEEHEIESRVEWTL